MKNFFTNFFNNLFCKLEIHNWDLTDEEKQNIKDGDWLKCENCGKVIIYKMGEF